MRLCWPSVAWIGGAHAARVRRGRRRASTPVRARGGARSGNLGVFDYFKMKNVESDTKMRTQIAAGEEHHVDDDRDKGKVKGDLHDKP